MQLAATTTPRAVHPVPAPGDIQPMRGFPRSGLDLPVWDSSLPIEAQKLDNQLEALFRFDGIRDSGDFNRAKLHELTAGWTKRFDELEALRGTILLHAPKQGGELTRVVAFGRSKLAVLEAADRVGATRKQLEAADSALIHTHNEMSPLRWGVPNEVREQFYVTPGDVARSRVVQFDGDGDSRIDAEEFLHVKLEGEMVFDDPKVFEQTFSGQHLFTLADERGATDGRTTVKELEAQVAAFDGNADGWLTKVEFDLFEQDVDARLIRQKPIGARFPEPVPTS